MHTEEVPFDILGCPFHTDPSEAAQRKAIMDGLGGIVNPLLVELSERVMTDESAVDVEALQRLHVAETPYEEVNMAGFAEHPYYFLEEEVSPTVSGAPARFEYCLETDIQGPAFVPDTAPLRIPVGFDGQYSRRLIRATAGVVKAAGLLRPRIRNVVEQDNNAQLLARHTYQGVLQQQADRALESIVTQGIVLSAQAEAVLTADSVQGYNTGTELARAVRQAGLPKEFTCRAGSGMLSTIVRHGRRVRPAVVPGEEERLELSSDLREYEKITRQGLESQIHEAFLLARSRQEPSMRRELTKRYHLKRMYGATCPASREGVPVALEAIAHVAGRLAQE